MEHFSDDGITTIQSAAEAAELAHLLELVFGVEDLKTWTSFHGREPYCGWEWCRIIKRHGRIAAHVCWVPRDIRIGSVAIKAGAIGYTATHPDYRGQGLAARLMQSWTGDLTRAGYHLSFLTGIPKFYEQFGYEFAFASDDRDPAVVVCPDMRRNEAPCATVRRYREGDLPAVALLYASDNHQRTGAFVRPEPYWEWLLQGLEASGKLKREDIWLIEDERHTVVGYGFMRLTGEGRYQLMEAAATTEWAAAELVNLAMHNAVAVRADVIDFQLPLDHMVTRQALQRGARLTAYSYGLYARILDLAGLLAALAPEFERRLGQSRWADWHGTLCIRTDAGDADIGIAGGRVNVGARTEPCDVVEIPQWLLVKLITGYTNVAGVIGPNRAAIPVHLRPVLNCLFSKGCPYMWNVDVGY
jgi:predicted N-acetyltransferase YhbS